MFLIPTKHVIVRLRRTCFAAPAQWEGVTEDRCPVYIKGRHGVLSARIGPAGGDMSTAVAGEELLRLPHEEADALSFEDMKSILAPVFDFSRLKDMPPPLDC